jgi:serine/threonine protein phosphatase PrpC
MIYYALTDIGKVRQTNEDAFFVSENGNVFAVADGMGGHHCGEIASNLAVTTVEKYTQTLIECPEEEVTDNLNQLANDIFFLISAKVSEDDLCSKMGTTLVVAVIRESSLYYAHLGDSRLYLLRNGVISRVTHDHSVVQELVDAKVITEVEALTHPMRNMVTRVLADGSEYIPDVNSISLYNGDKLLLCTDGLCGAVSDDVIKNELIKKVSPDEICSSLVNISLETGGNDNVTVIAIEHITAITDVKTEIKTVNEDCHWKNGFVALMSAIALFLILYIIAGVIYKKYIVKINPLTKNLAIFEYHPLIPFMPNKMVENSIVNGSDLNKIEGYKYIDFNAGKTIRSIEDGKVFLHEVEDSVKMQNNENIKKNESKSNNKVENGNDINKEPAKEKR